MLFDMLIILGLLLLNGFFAMSELAVVSARKPRLQALAEEGNRRAAVALALAEDPGRFLSSVQVGITLVGILAGAFGGATLAGPVAAWLTDMFPALAETADEVALTLVVGTITYLSLIIGELIPKQLALGNPERVAMRVARIMRLVARVAGPIVTLLDASTRLGLKLLGRGESVEQPVSDEEILMLIRQARVAGVVKHTEAHMLTGVMHLADLPVEAIMTPRPEIEWLDLQDDPAVNLERLGKSRFSRLPVARGDLDDLTGFIEAKDVLGASLDGERIDLAAMAKQPITVPESAPALRVVEMLKRSPVHMVAVIDEYGSVQGLVTPMEVLEAIVGGRLSDVGEAPEIVQRQDGSWLVDGGLAVGRLKGELGIRQLPEEGTYHTLAGFIMAVLARVPETGDSLEHDGYRFEVADMDGNRIDKVLVTRQVAAEKPEEPQEPGQ